MVASPNKHWWISFINSYHYAYRGGGDSPYLPYCSPIFLRNPWGLPSFLPPPLEHTPQASGGGLVSDGKMNNMFCVKISSHVYLAQAKLPPQEIGIQRGLNRTIDKKKQVIK